MSRRTLSTVCVVSSETEAGAGPEAGAAFDPGRAQLVDVVSGLEHHPDVHAAIAAAGGEESQRPAYLLVPWHGVAANGTIEERS